MKLNKTTFKSKSKSKNSSTKKSQRKPKAGRGGRKSQTQLSRFLGKYPVMADEKVLNLSMPRDHGFPASKHVVKQPNVTGKIQQVPYKGNQEDQHPVSQVKSGQKEVFQEEEIQTFGKEVDIKTKDPKIDVSDNKEGDKNPDMAENVIEQPEENSKPSNPQKDDILTGNVQDDKQEDDKKEVEKEVEIQQEGDKSKIEQPKKPGKPITSVKKEPRETLSSHENLGNFAFQHEEEKVEEVEEEEKNGDNDDVEEDNGGDGDGLFTDNDSSGSDQDSFQMDNDNIDITRYLVAQNKSKKIEIGTGLHKKWRDKFKMVVNTSHIRDTYVEKVATKYANLPTQQMHFSYAERKYHEVQVENMNMVKENHALRIPGKGVQLLKGEDVREALKLGHTEVFQEDYNSLLKRAFWVFDGEAVNQPLVARRCFRDHILNGQQITQEEIDAAEMKEFIEFAKANAATAHQFCSQLSCDEYASYSGVDNVGYKDFFWLYLSTRYQQFRDGLWDFTNRKSFILVDNPALSNIHFVNIGIPAGVDYPEDQDEDNDGHDLWDDEAIYNAWQEYTYDAEDMIYATVTCHYKENHHIGIDDVQGALKKLFQVRDWYMPKNHPNRNPQLTGIISILTHNIHMRNAYSCFRYMYDYQGTPFCNFAMMCGTRQLSVGFCMPALIECQELLKIRIQSSPAGTAKIGWIKQTIDVLGVNGTTAFSSYKERFQIIMFVCYMSKRYGLASGIARNYLTQGTSVTGFVYFLEGIRKMIDVNAIYEQGISLLWGLNGEESELMKAKSLQGGKAEQCMQKYPAMCKLGQYMKFEQGQMDILKKLVKTVQSQVIGSEVTGMTNNEVALLEEGRHIRTERFVKFARAYKDLKHNFENLECTEQEFVFRQSEENTDIYGRILYQNLDVELNPDGHLEHLRLLQNAANIKLQEAKDEPLFDVGVNFGQDNNGEGESEEGDEGLE